MWRYDTRLCWTNSCLSHCQGVPLRERQKPPEEEETEEKLFSDRWSGELNAWGSHMTRQELLFFKSWLWMKWFITDRNKPNYLLLTYSVIQNIFSLKSMRNYFVLLDINNLLSHWYIYIHKSSFYIHKVVRSVIIIRVTL